MLGTEGIELWWLIPLILIGLCLFWARGCCFGRRHRSEIDDAEYEMKGKDHHAGNERRDEMMAEKASQTNEPEEKGTVMDCCLPQRFTGMMGNCGDDMKRKCGAMMQEMMKGKFSPTEEK